MESYSTKLFNHPDYVGTNLFFLVILVFVSQFVMLPFFLEPSNVSKALFFSFFSFLVFFIFTPKKINFYIPDLFLTLILIVPIITSFFSSNKPFPFLASTLLISLILYRLKFEESFKSSLDLRVFFLRIFSLFVVILALLGTFEYFSYFLSGKSVLPLIPYLIPPNLSHRIGGIYGQPNLTALLLLTGILTLFYLYLHDDDFKTDRLQFLRFLPFLVVGVCFFLTGSRAGQLAMILTVLPLCLLVVRGFYLQGDFLRRRQFFLLCFLLVISYVVAYSLNTSFSVQGTRELSSVGMSSDARFVLWTAATLMFFDHPWLGIGLENYKFFLPEYVILAHDLLGFVEFEAMVYTAWAHNEFLQLISEGGGIVLLALVSAMICLFYPLFMFFRGRREWAPLKLYSHFFLIPFVIQSMFSWPLRYAPLLILFFTFVALLVSQYSGISVNLSWIHRLLLRFLCLCGLTFVLFVGFQEFHMGYLAKQIKYSSYQKTFAEFENLVTSDYIEYPLLMEAVPRYVKVSVDNNDIALAKKLLPHVKRLTEIHGAHWQWSYLAHIYLLLDRRDEAKVAITRAINLWPTKEMYWSFQHYLNMLKAAEHTGRPVNDFLPLQPGQTAQDLEGIFDFADRFRIYQ